MIVAPDRVGFGSAKKVRWFPRDEVGHAWVRKDVLVVAHLYGPGGEVVAVRSFPYHKADELRSAFAESGIPEHRPERLLGRRKRR